ncbi:MAG: helix-turn-helix transcriptional regulator [Pseudomonadota bacterium]|nr:helix-turn-helix transcriptional regulator [Pseudomonadota bacterium]
MNLKQWLDWKGWTLEKLADHIGLSVSQTSRICNAVSWPDPLTLARIQLVTGNMVLLDAMHRAWLERNAAEVEPKLAELRERLAVPQ